MKRLKQFVGLAIIFSLATFFSGCGAKRIHYDLNEKTWDPTSISKDNLQSKSYDTNRDGSPDVFEYYRLVQSQDYSGGAPVPTMVFKEMSIDFAAINVWRAYKNNGEVFREWYDTNGDARYDVETFFIDNKVVKKRYDLNNDMRPDMWKVFDEAGLLAERSIDSDADGKPDYWEFYEGGSVAEIKRDMNKDGEPD